MSIVEHLPIIGLGLSVVIAFVVLYRAGVHKDRSSPQSLDALGNMTLFLLGALALMRLFKSLLD